MLNLLGLKPNKSFFRGIFWICLYLLLCLSPLVIIMFRADVPRRDFWTEFSVALGFIGFTMLCMQFVLTARFKRLSAPYGIDVILEFHRYISLVAVSFILAHPIVIFAAHPETLRLLDPGVAPPRVILGVFSLLCLLGLVVISLFRKQLKISYGIWKTAHGVLALLALSAALFHMLGVEYYLSLPWKQNFVWLMTLAAMLALVYIRVLKPYTLRKKAYTLESIVPERGKAWTLTFRPEGHTGMRFHPGQFIWLTMGYSPFSIEDHPFSFTSSAKDTRTFAITIKELGDYTQNIGTARPGTRAYLEGPHGVFTYRRYSNSRTFVFIAGGIGITPIISMLRTLRDEKDSRRMVLFYCNQSWEAVTFREDLEQISDKLRLNIIHVLEDPPEDWKGESGYLTEKTIREYAPPDIQSATFFICGPPPLMRAAEKSLTKIGVKIEQIEMEKFNLV